MQERRSLFYTQEEIDTMKDVKKLETTNRDIIIDTLYLGVNNVNDQNVCSLYLCDSSGTIQSKKNFPGTGITMTGDYVYLSGGHLSFSYKYGSISIYSYKQWIDTGGEYYNYYSLLPESIYGKLYMPIRVPYLKYIANTEVKNLDGITHIIYYKEYEP